MMKKPVIILLIALIYGIDVLSQQTSINTVSMPFLLINSDARSGGMGDIGVATSSDIASLHHNPSKIAFNKYETSIGVNYSPWLRNLANDIFVGGASYISHYEEKSAWGVNVKYFSLGEIQLSNNTGKSIGTGNPNEIAITGAYSLKLSNKFSMGVALKYINSNYKIISETPNLNNINSLAVDVSGYFQSKEKSYGAFNGRYRLGFNIANIGPKVEYTPEFKSFIPTNLKIGSGFDFLFKKKSSLGINLELTKLLVPSDIASTNGWLEGIFTSFGDSDNELQEITWALGAEYTYNDNFSLRTGYFHESEFNGNRNFLSVGAGFKAKSFTINLSYLINNSETINPLENTLRFSLSFDMGEFYE